MRKFLGTIILLVVLVVAGLIYWNYYNVFGEGVKSGQLNYLVKKGNIFKTYEGKLIQSGFRSKQAGSIQSYEFEFSVERKDLADRLMTNSGKEFDLHYKEYRGSLPWRGFSTFVVDSILAMREVR
jgi:hypothetical protein